MNPLLATASQPIPHKGGERTTSPLDSDQKQSASTLFSTTCTNPDEQDAELHCDPVGLPRTKVGHGHATEPLERSVSEGEPGLAPEAVQVSPEHSSWVGNEVTTCTTPTSVEPCQMRDESDQILVPSQQPAIAVELTRRTDENPQSENTTSTTNASKEPSQNQEPEVSSPTGLTTMAWHVGSVSSSPTVPLPVPHTGSAVTLQSEDQQRRKGPLENSSKFNIQLHPLLYHPPTEILQPSVPGLPTFAPLSLLNIPLFISQSRSERPSTDFRILPDSPLSNPQSSISSDLPPLNPELSFNHTGVAPEPGHRAGPNLPGSQSSLPEFLSRQLPLPQLPQHHQSSSPSLPWSLYENCCRFLEIEQEEQRGQQLKDRLKVTHSLTAAGEGQSGAQAELKVNDLTNKTTAEKKQNTKSITKKKPKLSRRAWLASQDTETLAERAFEDYIEIMDSLCPQMIESTENTEIENEDEVNGKEEEEENGSFMEYLDELCSDEEFVKRVGSILNIDYLNSLLSSDPESIDLIALEEQREQEAELQQEPDIPATDANIKTNAVADSTSSHVADSYIEQTEALMQPHNERALVSSLDPPGTQFDVPVMPHTGLTIPNYSDQNAPLFLWNREPREGQTSNFLALPSIMFEHFQQLKSEADFCPFQWSFPPHSQPQNTIPWYPPVTIPQQDQPSPFSQFLPPQGLPALDSYNGRDTPSPLYAIPENVTEDDSSSVSNPVDPRSARTSCEPVTRGDEVKEESMVKPRPSRRRSSRIKAIREKEKENTERTDKAVETRRDGATAETERLTPVTSPVVVGRRTIKYAELRDNEKQSSQKSEIHSETLTKEENGANDRFSVIAGPSTCLSSRGRQRGREDKGEDEERANTANDRELDELKDDTKEKKALEIPNSSSISSSFPSFMKRRRRYYTDETKDEKENRKEAEAEKGSEEELLGPITSPMKRGRRARHMERTGEEAVGAENTAKKEVENKRKKTDPTLQSIMPLSSPSTKATRNLPLEDGNEKVETKETKGRKKQTDESRQEMTQMTSPVTRSRRRGIHVLEEFDKGGPKSPEREIGGEKRGPEPPTSSPKFISVRNSKATPKSSPLSSPTSTHLTRRRSTRTLAKDREKKHTVETDEETGLREDVKGIETREIELSSATRQGGKLSEGKKEEKPSTSNRTDNWTMTKERDATENDAAKTGFVTPPVSSPVMSRKPKAVSASDKTESKMGVRNKREEAEDSPSPMLSPLKRRWSHTQASEERERRSNVNAETAQSVDETGPDTDMSGVKSSPMKRARRRRSRAEENRERDERKNPMEKEAGKERRREGDEMEDRTAVSHHKPRPVSGRCKNTAPSEKEMTVTGSSASGGRAETGRDARMDVIDGETKKRMSLRFKGPTDPTSEVSQPQRADDSISENRAGEASTSSGNKDIHLHPRQTRLFCKMANKYKEFTTWKPKVLGKKRMAAKGRGNGGKREKENSGSKEG